MYRAYAIKNGLVNLHQHRDLAGFSNPMTHYEAVHILNLQDFEEINKTMINKAYVHLISANHPDRGIVGFAKYKNESSGNKKGGSLYLTQKIIEAKEFLIE